MPHTSVAFCASLYLVGMRWTIFIWLLLTDRVWDDPECVREGFCTLCSSVSRPSNAQPSALSVAGISGSHLSSQIVSAFESGTSLHLPLSLSRRYLARVFSRDIVQ